MSGTTNDPEWVSRVGNRINDGKYSSLFGPENRRGRQASRSATNGGRRTRRTRRFFPIATQNRRRREGTASWSNPLDHGRKRLSRYGSWRVDPFYPAIRKTTKLGLFAVQYTLNCRYSRRAFSFKRYDSMSRTRSRYLLQFLRCCNASCHRVRKATSTSAGQTLLLEEIVPPVERLLRLVVQPRIVGDSILGLHARKSQTFAGVLSGEYVIRSWSKFEHIDTRIPGGRTDGPPGPYISFLPLQGHDEPRRHAKGGDGIHT